MKTKQKNTKNIQKWWRKTCRSMAWCFANVLTSPQNAPKSIMSNHQTSSTPPRNSFKDTCSKFHPRLAVEKVKVIEVSASAKPWSAAVRSAVTRAVDTEAAAAVLTAEDVHSIGHVAPDRCVATARCGRRSARGQLTPAIGLAKALPKSNHDMHSTIFFQLPHLPFVTYKMGLEWLRCI